MFRVSDLAPLGIPLPLLLAPAASLLGSPCRRASDGATCLLEQLFAVPATRGLGDLGILLMLPPMVVSRTPLEFLGHSVMVAALRAVLSRRLDRHRVGGVLRARLALRGAESRRRPDR